MNDITQRLIAHNSCGCGCSSDTRRLISEAADEIERLRGELENVQRHRMAQVEVERLRALITEWADANVWYYTTDDVSNAPAERVKAAEDALRREASR
jgi:hypothetical protein